MNEKPLPIGKLPHELLARLIAAAPQEDPRLRLGPGIGLDCAVIDMGNTLLVYKSDPITFAADNMGWYLVHINANDIATTGARPRWLLVTLLLPEQKTTPALVEELHGQIVDACRRLKIDLIGGHTEITHGLDRPIAVGAMIGETAHDKLVTPRGAAPGDHILLTKGIPIEATAILAREFPERLADILSPDEVEEAQNFLTNPGISVLPDAQTAVAAGHVTAMHDPTEGGLAAALWELAEASRNRLVIDPTAVPIPPLSARICDAFHLDPMQTIASGALLLTVAAADATAVRRALEAEGITCAEIGKVEAGETAVLHPTPDGLTLLSRPDQDAIGQVYETDAPK